jgi:outer membrane murein-binding lipoprotein Lpp
MSAPVEVLSRLLWLRDAATLPDQALADQLGLEPKFLTALVQSHPERFHESLVFPLTAEERQKIPDAPILAFTEAGAALLTGLLPGKESALLALLPAFAEARHVLSAQAELSARVAALEQKLDLVVKTLQADQKDGSHAERPIGFVPEDLPKGLKAKQQTARKR